MKQKLKEMFTVLLTISTILTSIPTPTYAAASSLPVVWLTGNYDEVYDFYYGAARVKKDNKWGLIDKAGKEIVPVTHDLIYGFEYDFKDGLTLFMDNEKYGLMNSKGSIIAPAVYDQIEPFREGLARVTKDGKNGFINKNGEMVVALKYDRANLGFKEGLAAVAIKVSDDRNGYKFGYIDKSGKEVIPLKYTYANDFSEGLAWVAIGKSFDIRYGAVDMNGNEIIPFKYIEVRDFSSGIARVDVGGNNDEYINKTGQTIISSGFDIGADCKEGMVWTQSLAGYGSWHYLRDNEGNKINVDGPIYSASDFKDGLSRISKQGGIYTYIDKTGKEIYHPVASISEFVDGFSIVQDVVGNQAKYGAIDKTGKVVVPFMYDSIGDFSEGLAAVSKGGKRGYVGTSGKLVLPVPYPVISPFKEGLAIVRTGMYYGAIDKTGKEIIPTMYQNINDFKEGYAIVNDDNFRKGVVDSNGEVVVPLNFNKINDFNQGAAIAKQGEKWAIILSPNSYIYDLEKEANAMPTSSKVMVNGKNVPFEAYNIGGNNYFKLRDLAAILKETEKQFNVTWDDSKKAINILSNTSYKSIDGEMMKGNGKEKTASLNKSAIFKDGSKVNLAAYTIGENNYFMLRDIGKTIGFEITWDDKTNTIKIDTTKGYKKE